MVVGSDKYPSILSCSISLLLCCYGWMGCGSPTPSFNPFDDSLVEVEVLYKDTTLEVVGDCSGFVYTKNQGEHSTCYFVCTYLDSVVGKGMSIPLPIPKPTPLVVDSTVANIDSLYKQLQNQYITYIKLLPYDTTKVDSILNIYDLTRTSTFSKWNTIFDREDFFLVCENSQGQEYVFEYQYHPAIWLGRRAFGKKALVFDTYVTRESLELDYQYN